MISKNKNFQGRDDSLADKVEAKKWLDKKHLLIFARIGVAVLALLWVLKDVKISDFSHMSPFIFAASVGLYFLAQLPFVARWNLLLRAQQIHIGYFTALKLHLLGLFYNNCLPSSVGGDFLRAWYVTKHTEKKTEAALSVFIDRIIGLSGTIITASVCYFLIPTPEFQIDTTEQSNVSSGNGLAGYGTVLIVVLSIIAVALAAVAMYPKARKSIQKLTRRLWVQGLDVAGKLISAMRLYSKKPLVVLAAFALTFLCQGMSIIAFWVIGRNIGIEAPIKYYFVFFPLSWVLGALPISIGGAGVMELGLKGMFMKIGVSSSLSARIALVQRLIWLITSLPGVVIHFKGAHLPNEEFFIDSDEAMN